MLTSEELTIRTAIETRLATLREALAAHQREAVSHQQAAQRHATEAVRLSGGVAELEQVLVGFDQDGPTDS